MKEFYKNHIIDLLLAILFLALGIVLLPVFEISTTILDYVVALVLVIYLFTFLVKKLTASRGTILVLTVVEFIIILLIALGLVLKNLKVFTIGETCQIIGLVFWLRGVVCLIRGYFVSTPTARHKYSLLLFMGYIALVTLGTWLFVAPIITDGTLALMLCISAFALFALLLVLTIVYWPKKKGEKKKAKSKKKAKEEKSLEAAKTDEDK